MIAWRHTPAARHVRLEALTVAAVFDLAFDELDSRGECEARELFRRLDASKRLVAALAVLGQALRVPVAVHGGACDVRGLSAAGNHLSWLMGSLAGDRASYTARGTRYALARGEAAGILVRDVRILAEPPPGVTRYTRRFGIGTTYATAAELRAWYRTPELAELVRAVGRLAPARWIGEARRARTGDRGYWGAIRRSRGDLADLRARRTRAAFWATQRAKWASKRSVPNVGKRESIDPERMSKTEHHLAFSMPSADAGRGGGGSEAVPRTPPPGYYAARARLGSLPTRSSSVPRRPALPLERVPDPELEALLSRSRVRGGC